MENATKALLIAASVLIAIVLIAVGLKILAPSEKAVDQTTETLSMTEIAIYNSQFTKYEGIQRGTEAKALLNLVKVTVGKGKNFKVAFKQTGQDTVSIDSSVSIDSGQTALQSFSLRISLINTSINSSKNYSINTGVTNNDGYVDYVSIVEQ